MIKNTDTGRPVTSLPVILQHISRIVGYNTDVHSKSPFHFIHKIACQAQVGFER